MPHVAAHQAAFRLARSCSFSSSCSICFLIFSFSLLSRFRARSFSSSRWSMNFLMCRSRMQRRSLSILSVGSSFCSRRKRACNCFISCWVVRGRRTARVLVRSLFRASVNGPGRTAAGMSVRRLQTGGKAVRFVLSG